MTAQEVSVPEPAEQAEHIGNGRTVNGRAVRVRPDGLAWRQAGDEAVVLDLAAARYHALNASGALLWQRLDSWATADQLTAVLVSAFGLAPADAARGRRRLPDRMRRRGAARSPRGTLIPAGRGERLEHQVHGLVHAGPVSRAAEVPRGAGGER